MSPGLLHSSLSSGSRAQRELQPQGLPFIQVPRQRQRGSMPSPGVTVGITIRHRQSLGFTLLLSSHFTHTVFLTARMSHSSPKLKATAYSWTFLSETNGHGYKPYISTFILLPTLLQLPVYCNDSYYKLFLFVCFFFLQCAPFVVSLGQMENPQKSG